MALKPIVLIIGAELVLADRALAAALTERSDFERTTLDGGELEPGRFGEAVAPSLFADKRVLVLKDLQDVTADVAAEITSLFPELDPNLHLIFVHKGGVKGKALVETIKKLKAEVITCDTMKKVSEKEEFVRSEFSRLGRKISSDAVTALINATGSDTRELAAACSQIASDIDPSLLIIGEDEVARYYQGRVEASGFDVADATIAGDPRAALVALRSALDTGSDPVMIISALANSVRVISKVAAAPRGANPYALASSLSLAPWQIEKARRQLTKWTPAMITSSIKELAHADIAVKGGEADPLFALERAVIAIATNVAAGQRR